MSEFKVLLERYKSLNEDIDSAIMVRDGTNTGEICLPDKALNLELFIKMDSVIKELLKRENFDLLDVKDKHQIKLHLISIV